MWMLCLTLRADLGDVRFCILGEILNERRRMWVVRGGKCVFADRLSGFFLINTFFKYFFPPVHDYIKEGGF